jgi:hypothetical protein
MSAPARGETPGVERLRGLLLARGGLVASLLAESDRDSQPERPASSRVAELAAAGPRAAGRRAEYELLLEAIYEGYLLHYGAPRLMTDPEADLGLLAGDQLYAIGLAELVSLGDTQAVAELADTITLSALARGTGDEELAEAVWEAGARAVGWGPTAEHGRAKQLLREGAPEALAAMRTSAGGSAEAP